MRARRGLIASCLLLALVSVGNATGDPARASVKPAAAPGPHHDHSDAAEHAAEDLAGTPISTIEKKTGDNAERIRRATGVRPGTARPQRGATAAGPATALAVSADPGQSGSWSSVIDTQVVPVFSALLPNGKVLIWASVGDNAAESYTDHSFTRAMVWTPSTNTFKRVDVQGSNIFCAGFSHLANGDILVAGGNANAELDGTVQTHVFHWQTETWTRGKDMAAARWYPSVAEMANGEATIVGGGPATAEVYQTNGAIRPLTGFTKYSNRVYPFLISRPDTQLGLLGPYATTYTVNTAGNGLITGSGTRDPIFRGYGSFATYDIGKTLVVGGGSLTEGGATEVPTKTAVVVNSNAGQVPTVTSTGSMSVGRRQFNATLLADGSVLATGGETSAATSNLVDLENAATSAERWNPPTGQWTVLASASRIRQYHSTAMLLPDGRVMTGGGGVCGRCMDVGYLEKNIEYFTPPYLFKHDGSGQLAARPVISTAPASISLNTNFTITSSQAASIRKVALVGLADVTHDVDQGQRYVPLRYSVSGTTLTVTGPPNGGVAPPGYYMLTVTDSAGVPSVAKIVKLAQGPRPLMSPVKLGTGTCIDLPGSSTAYRTYLWTYTCNGTKAQALTRLPNDSSLRVLGNCVDVPGSNFVTGQRVWSYGCNNSSAQKWQFGTDGTIRPVSKTTLCLAAASSLNKAVVRLATCNGTALQKWTW